MNEIVRLYNEIILGRGLRNRSEQAYDALAFTNEIYELYVKPIKDAQERSKFLLDRDEWRTRLIENLLEVSKDRRKKLASWKKELFEDLEGNSLEERSKS